MFKHRFAGIVTIILIAVVSGFAHDTEKDEEIRHMFWNSSDENFSRTHIPEKWINESAVIIAQKYGFEYKKPALVRQLQFNKQFHNRIKLIDKNAVEEYAEISFLSSNDTREVLVGFKVIKPDGREIVIDPSTAVMMEREGDSGQSSYKKIAIPNLETGDILDYYIYEEHEISLANYIYFFEPVLYHLPREYPVINQKITFNIQRRCFVSLKSLNGAPELSMEVDEENDEQIYYLEDTDREAVSDVRWFYPYRELPAIKFRAVYMSKGGQKLTSMLVGDPGEVKTNVSEKELSDFVSYMVNSIITDPSAIVKHVKKNVAKDADNFEKARAGYYFYRNTMLDKTEVLTVSSDSRINFYAINQLDSRLQFLDRFAGFLSDSKIPFDIIAVIPREISGLDDLLIEHELQYMIRVKKGNEYLYFSYFDPYKIPGEIDESVQGTDAYYFSSVSKNINWDAQRMTVPLSGTSENAVSKQLQVTIQPDFKTVEVNIEATAKGYFKSDYQNNLIDYYDYEQEERSKFEMKEGFSGNSSKKKLLNLRESYLQTRDKKHLEALEGLVKSEYEFDVSSVSELEILSTGRFEEKPDVKFSYDLSSEDLITRAGPNYMLEIGKLIEAQVKIEDNELEREVGIFMNAPRSFDYKITVAIPEGYEVKGIEDLNVNVENGQGGFISSASIEGNTVIVKSRKFYNSIHVEAGEWNELVEFLNAAYNFSEKKILLKKK